MSDSESNYSQVFSFDTNITYADNAIVSKKIITNKGGNVTLFSFDKDQALSEHSAPFDALVQVLEGSAEIIINKEVFQLEKGQSIVMPANITHALRAIEKFKMLLTMVKN